MGLKLFGGGRSSANLPRRAWYPSGPWVDGIRPAESTTVETEKKPRKKKQYVLPNPDPNDYKIVQAKEIGNILIIKVNYPACTNFEGNKILVYRGITLVDLANQRLIDPHFFEHEKYASPIARFVPTDEGWDMAVMFAEALTVPR